MLVDRDERVQHGHSYEETDILFSSKFSRILFQNYSKKIFHGVFFFPKPYKLFEMEIYLRSVSGLFPHHFSNKVILAIFIYHERLAFGNDKDIFHKYIIADSVFDLFCLLDIFVSFFVAIEIRGEYVYDRKLIAKEYLT